MVVNGLRCRNSLRELEALREDISNVAELGINTENTAIHMVEIDPYDSRQAAFVTLTDEDLDRYEGLIDELYEVMESDEWLGHYLYHVVYPCDTHFYQIYYHNDMSYKKGKWIKGNVIFYHHTHDVKLHVILTRPGQTVSESRAFDEMEMEYLYRHATKIVNHVTTTLENSNIKKTSASFPSFSHSSSMSPSTSQVVPATFNNNTINRTLSSSSSFDKLSPTSTTSRYFSPISPTTRSTMTGGGQATVLSADPSTFTGTNGSTITIDPNLPTPSYRKSPNTSTGYIFPTSPVKLNPNTNMLYTVDMSSVHK